MTFAEQIKKDIQAWQQLMESQDLPENQRFFLQQILLLLYHVGLMVSEDITKGYQYAKRSSLPLVSYLCHGANITIEIEKELLEPLFHFLCVDPLSIITESADTQISGNKMGLTQLITRIMRKYTAPIKALESRPKYSNTATDQYAMILPLAGGTPQLILSIAKGLIGNIRLGFALEGYPQSHLFPASNAPDAVSDVLRLHKAAEYRADREFLIPHKLYGVKGSLSQDEFHYIKHAVFKSSILAKPPAEHSPGELDSQLLAPIFARLNKHDLPDYMEHFLEQYVYPHYEEYRILDIHDYNARKDFLGEWIGNAEKETTCLVKLYISLKRQEFDGLDMEQQQKILQEIVEPLLRESSRELMAVLDLRTHH